MKILFIYLLTLLLQCSSAVLSHSLSLVDQENQDKQPEKVLEQTDKRLDLEQKLKQLKALELQIKEDRKELQAEAVRKHRNEQPFKKTIRNNFKNHKSDKKNKSDDKFDQVLSLEVKLKNNISLMKENMPLYFQTLEKGRDVVEKIRAMENKSENQDAEIVGKENESMDYEAVLDEETSSEFYDEAKDGFLNGTTVDPLAVKDASPVKLGEATNKNKEVEYFLHPFSSKILAPVAVKETSPVEAGAVTDKKDPLAETETTPIKVETDNIKNDPLAEKEKTPVKVETESLDEKETTPVKVGAPQSKKENETGMMKNMLEMMEEIKKDVVKDESNNVHLSIEEQSKRIQNNGSIFSIEFRPKNKTKIFSLTNGDVDIHEGNSIFGSIIETDNTIQSENNMFIPKSILDPEKVNNSITVILTYVKRKNPLIKIKPQFRSMFEHKYVFWEIPEEFRKTKALVVMQISSEQKQSWKEVQQMRTDEMYTNLVEFDVTETLKDVKSPVNGRIIMKTEEDIYESDAIKLKEAGSDQNAEGGKKKKARNYTAGEI